MKTRTLPGNCPENRATMGRKLTSVSFLSELTDENKIRQWDGLFIKKVLGVENKIREKRGNRRLPVPSLFLFYFTLCHNDSYGVGVGMSANPSWAKASSVQSRPYPSVASVKTWSASEKAARLQLSNRSFTPGRLLFTGKVSW